MINLKELEKEHYVLYDPTLSTGQLVLVHKDDGWFGKIISVSEAYEIATKKGWEFKADGRYRSPYVFAYELNNERNIPTKSSKIVATYCLEKNIIPSDETILATERTIAIAKEILGISRVDTEGNYCNASSEQVSKKMFEDIKSLK